jgi:hypothetical protein
LKLREMLMTNSALVLRLERIDRTVPILINFVKLKLGRSLSTIQKTKYKTRTVERHDGKIRDLYRIVTRFAATRKKPKGPIGFQP